MKIVEYIDFVRQLPCCVTASKAVDPHHIRSQKYIPYNMSGGVGLKPSDYMCIPLTREFHEAAHRNPTMLTDLIDPGKEIIKCLVQYIEYIRGEIDKHNTRSDRSKKGSTGPNQ